MNTKTMINIAIGVALGMYVVPRVRGMVGI